MRRRLLVPVIVAGLTATTWILAVGHPGQDESAEPSMDQLMAAVMQYATPGPAHAFLNPMLGEWNLEGRHRFTKDSEWSSFTARARTEWILGDRFLRQSVHTPPTENSPQGYDGLSLIGYDVRKEQYTYLYLDSYSTAMPLYHGTRNEEGLLDLRTTVPDLITGQPEPARATFQMTGPDEMQYRDYTTGPDGGQYVSVEIAYRRASAGQ